jgi:hypothetical protein
MIFDSWGGVLADGAFQEFSLAYTARVLAQLKREHDGVRIPASSSPRAAGCGWTRWPRSTVTCWAWTGPSTWDQGARAGGWQQGAAGQYRPQCAVCRPRNRSRPKWPRCWTALAPPTPARHRADPYFQPGPRHQPAHPTGKRGSAGQRGACALAQDALSDFSAIHFAASLSTFTPLNDPSGNADLCTKLRCGT